MRSFLILGFLAASASAGVLSGYNYGPGVSGIREEILPASSGSSFAYGSDHYNSGSYSNGGIISSSGSGSFNNGHYQQYSIGIDALDSIPQTVQYSKQFYHFDAPAEPQLEGRITKQLSNTLKKNLQVVFIKAPENNAATNAALQLAKQAIEQKTAIYVLSKQHDEAQLVGQLQQIQENVQTAPEVRFVKYRTPEDVQRAKQSIQAQYDNVGGISEIYNGGYAPVLNYASAAKPFQFVFGEPNKASGKYYKTVYNKSGSGSSSSSSSANNSPLSTASGSYSSGSASGNFASGSSTSSPLASGSASFASGSGSSKFTSGSSITAPQKIGTSSIISESAPTKSESFISSSSLSFGSSSNFGSASGAASQLNEDASSDSSSINSGTGSYISSEYLPPLKK